MKRNILGVFRVPPGWLISIFDVALPVPICRALSREADPWWVKKEPRREQLLVTGPGIDYAEMRSSSSSNLAHRLVSDLSW